MTVPARLWRWGLGLLLDGLGRVQRPHREGDRLRRQGICRRRRGRNRRVGLVAGRRFLGQRQHGEHHERRRRVSARVSFQRSARCHSRRDAVDGVRAGFRNDISYGSIAPPVTYVLFAAFIILMKAATVFAMRGLKQAK